MKKTVLMIALALLSPSAFASKARVQALGNPFHLIDIQNAMTRNPVELTEFGDWATFEFGAADYNAHSNQAAADGQEGGFVRSAGDARWGLYLGHKDEFFVTPTRVISSHIAQENSTDFFYAMKGDLKWAVDLEYSNSNKKSATKKQSAAVLRAGVRGSSWDAYTHVGLANSAEDTTTKLAGKTGVTLGGGYYMDSIYIYGQYMMRGFKVDNVADGSPNKDFDGTDITLGVLDSVKKEGTEFFYGASIVNSTLKEKVASNKWDSQRLPVIIGLEHEATSWLVLRASVTQSVLIGTYKATENHPIYSAGKTNGESDTLAETSSVAAGVGLKFNKVIIDGTLKAANTTAGDFGADGANFMGNASLTYNF